MKKFPPKFLLKTHLYCAAFIMPIALMFLGTGLLLFTLDMGGDYYRTEYSIQLKQPLERDTLSNSGRVERRVWRLTQSTFGEFRKTVIKQRWILVIRTSF